ncbi:heterokaryon incompatibility protein-domain-containing protein, partial [Macrophomina phaseolina]
WLEACNKDHKCLRSKQNFMPLRLIQINSRDPLRRITVVHCTRAVHYAALSYCWGGSLRFKTTSHSLASVQAGIPSEVLPQTVQDAVSVALELGLQYLWVDSLCIVQDDEDEMTDQIAQMAKIFEGAYITIAASQAARSSDGFLSLRNPFSLVCRVKIAHRNGENLKYGVGRPASHSFGKQPLASRAWTLQEIFLSRRILSFEHGHMHWYCLQDAKGNCSQPVFKFSMYGLNPGFDGKIELQSVSEWIEIVHQYSRRQLTYGSDKLLAISAVAEWFSRCAWGRYFAGVWEKDLLS